MEFCPRLIALTCLYISTKVEECSTIAPANKFHTTIKLHGTLLLQTKIGSAVLDSSWNYEMRHLLECEYYVLETLEISLIIFHPYRPLLELYFF